MRRARAGTPPVQRGEGLHATVRRAGTARGAMRVMTIGSRDPMLTRRAVRAAAVGAAALCASLLVAPVGSDAHPMGNFSISHYSALTIRPTGVEVRHVLDLAEVPTFQEMQDHGIVPDSAHASASAYLARKAAALGAGLVLEVNGRRLAWERGPREILFTPGAGDLPTMKLGVVYRASFAEAAAGQQNDLVFRDTNFPDRVGWKEVIAAAVPGVTVRESSVPDRDRSRALADYPTDLLDSPPQVLGATVAFTVLPASATAAMDTTARPIGDAARAVVATPAGIAKTAPAASPPVTKDGSPTAGATATLHAPASVTNSARPGGAVSIPASATVGASVGATGSATVIGTRNAPQDATPSAGPGLPAADERIALEPNRRAAPPDRLAALVATPQIGVGMLAVAVLVAAALGALHALEPGHGKAVVAAYLVGSRGTARHALWLGLIVTASHTAGVYLLGGVTLYASRYVVPERLYPWLGAVSGLVIAVLGFALFLRRYASPAGAHHHHGHAHHGHHHVHGHTHAGDHVRIGGHTHASGHVEPRRRPGQPHHDAHHPVGGVSFRHLLALGVTGGMIPCPGALVVLLSAIALRRVGFGLVLIAAFSVGLAAVLIAIGLLMVYARRAMARFRGDGRVVTRWLPLTSSAVMAVLGVAIAVQALMAGGIVQVRLG